jgi:hypothetical protein
VTELVKLAHAKWEVRWVGSGGKINVRDFGTDFAGATRLYAKAAAAGKRAPTLRCKNIQHPPPPKYADTELVPIGRRKRTKQIVYRRQTTDPPLYLVRMRKLNAQGIWWCGYCRELRRFVRKEGFRVDGIWVDDPHWACPMCGASHTLVAKYNPMAAELNIRRASGKKRRSRRRKRG